MLDLSYVRFGLSFIVSIILWPVTYLCEKWGSHLGLIAWLVIFAILSPRLGVVLP